MSWATRTFPCPDHGEQRMRGMGAHAVTLACGAVGSDGQYAHHDEESPMCPECPDPLPCAKCGTPTIVGSADLAASLCLACCVAFSIWADSHPHEPYANFIHPKPWDMGRKDTVMATCDNPEVEHPGSPTKLTWAELAGVDPDYTDGKPVDQWLEERHNQLPDPLDREQSDTPSALIAELQTCTNPSTCTH